MDMTFEDLPRSVVLALVEQTVDFDSTADERNATVELLRERRVDMRSSFGVAHAVRDAYLVIRRTERGDAF